MSNDFCWYCGSPLYGKKKSRPTKHRLTFDHQTPKCRGGTAVAETGESNLVKACFHCNHEKHDLTVEEYRAVVAVREGRIKIGPEEWVFFGELDADQKRRFLLGENGFQIPVKAVAAEG